MDFPVSTAVGDVQNWLVCSIPQDPSVPTKYKEDKRFAYYANAVVPYLNEWAKSQPKKGGLHDNLRRDKRAQYKACRAFVKANYKPAYVTVTTEGNVVESKGGLILTLILLWICEAAISWAVTKYLEWLWNSHNACLSLTDIE